MIKIYRNSITAAKPLEVNEKFTERDFGNVKQNYPLDKIVSAYIGGTFENEDGFLIFRGEIGGVLALHDARSNEIFDYPVTVSDDVEILEDDDGEGEGYIFSGNCIELEILVASVLQSEIPIKPLKPGSEGSLDVAGIHIMSEEEAQEDKGSPFDILANLND